MGARPLGRDSKLKDFSKSSYINTKRKIKDELGITDKDWFTYNQVLKKEGKIECSRHKWSICSGG